MDEHIEARESRNGLFLGEFTEKILKRKINRAAERRAHIQNDVNQDALLQLMNGFTDSCLFYPVTPRDEEKPALPGGHVAVRVKSYNEMTRTAYGVVVQPGTNIRAVDDAMRAAMQMEGLMGFDICPAGMIFFFWKESEAKAAAETFKEKSLPYLASYYLRLNNRFEYETQGQIRSF